MTLADNLATARCARSFYAYQAGDGPADHAGAYAIQAEVAKLTGNGVAGWKTGFAPKGQGIAIAGPLFSDDTRPNGGAYRLARGEWVIVEVELALRLARDLPKGPNYSVDDILDAADEVLTAGIDALAMLGNAAVRTAGLDWQALPVAFGGGVLTGEHGVGLHKIDFLVQEHGEGAIDVMRTLKHALDPNNILNPGKVVRW